MVAGGARSSKALRSHPSSRLLATLRVRALRGDGDLILFAREKHLGEEPDRELLRSRATCEEVLTLDVGQQHPTVDDASAISMLQIRNAVATLESEIGASLERYLRVWFGSDQVGGASGTLANFLSQ